MARDLISRQSEDQDCRVVIMDLTLPEPDYDALLEAVFDSDSISVW